MNKNTLHYVVIFLLSLTVQPALAKSRVTLVEDTEHFTLADSNPMLLGEHLLYQTTEDEGVTLWSHNIETNQRVSLFEGLITSFQVTGEHSSEHKQLLRNGDLAFFIVGGYDEKFLWRSDGTPTGTFKLDSSPVFQDLVVSQGLVFTQSVGGQIIATDGLHATEHQFIHPDAKAVCAFGLNDVITRDFDSSTAEGFIKRSQNGVVTEIPLPFSGQFFSVKKENVWQIGDTCMIGLLGSGLPSDVLLVSESGEVNFLSERYDTSGLQQIFVLNDRLYAREFQNNQNQLVRMNESLDGTDKVFTVSGDLALYHSEVLNGYIVANTTTPLVSPAINFTHYFDNELNELENLGGAFLPIPEFFPTSNEPIYVTESRTQNITTTLLSNHISMMPLEFSVKDAFVDEITTHEARPEVYLMLRDKVTAKRSIVTLTDSPGIGDSINGMWHDPEIQNQGLSIHTGERGDGSKYIFATVYTYYSGSPLWLAGVANIDPPQSSIEMLVGKYSNSNMFDPVSTPTEEVFGSLTLEMTSCDQLRVTLTSDDAYFDLDLSRIDNVHYNHLCNSDLSQSTR